MRLNLGSFDVVNQFEKTQFDDQIPKFAGDNV